MKRKTTPRRAPPLRKKSVPAVPAAPVAAAEAPIPSQPPSLSRPQLLLLGFGVASILAGQLLHQAYPSAAARDWTVPTLAGLLIVGLGLAEGLFARLAAPLASRVTTLRERLDTRTSRLPHLLAALLLSASAAYLAGDQPALRLPGFSLGFWLAGIALMLHATSAVGRLSARLPRWEFIGLGALLVTALAARVVLLDRIPWLLAGDEASVGISAREFLDGAWNNPFRVAWYSFPSLFFLIPAASIRLFGQTIEALRLPAVVAGSLTVAALFFYGRAAFGRTLAFFSAAYLVFFHFHIHFSRIALNNIWDGLVFALFAYLLWRAWSEERPALFAWAGLVAGLGLYFYTSARLLFVMLPVWLLVAWLRERTKVRRIGANWIVLLASAAVVVLPLAVFFASHPGEFNAPMARVSLLGGWLEREVAATGEPGWRILLDRLGDSALAFTGRNLTHWYKIDHPMLLPLPATLFLIGLLVSFWRALDLRYTWLLLWLGAGVAVGGLSESTPAAQRYIFVAPAVAVLVTLPLAEVAARFSQNTQRKQTLLVVGLSAVLTIAAAADLQFYFGDYTPSRRFSDPNTEVAQDLGLLLRDSGLEVEGVQVYFFGQPRMGWKSIQTLPYLAPQAKFVDNLEPLSAAPDWEIPLPAAFVFLPENLRDLEWVRQAYPQGEILERNSARGGPLYTLYLVR